MATRNVKRKLVAILAADAVGFSRLMGGNEEQTMRVLNAHRSVIDGIIEYHEGRIVGTAGDSVLAEFGSPTDAVRCAVEIQDALKTRNNSLPEAERLHFRIGINLGDVMIKGDDLLGDGVNIAARLESIAEPGGICISASIYDQIAGKLDLGFVEIGEQHLKNIERPIRVYRVGTGVARPAPVPSAPMRKAHSRWLYVAGGAAVVLVAIAAVLRLREAPPAPAQPVTAAAPAHALEVEIQRAQEAQRVLEAQWAAEEKSKTEIAAAKARADAEIAKARAGTEVARARAETEAVRRQAAAELAAARAKQAETPPASAPAAVTPVPPASVASRAQSATAWTAQRNCDPDDGSPSIAQHVSVKRNGEEFVLETGQPGQPRYFLVQGKPSTDGTLVLTGYVISGAASSRGREVPVVLRGHLSGDSYEMKGRIGRRSCTVLVTRR